MIPNKTVFFLLFLSIFLTDNQLSAQKDLKVLQGWRAFNDAPNALYHELIDQAIPLMEERKQNVNRIRTLQEWQNKQQWVRKTMDSLIGPFPEKTPLNPKKVRTFVKNDFKVEHIIFESQPGFYITSSLFIPSGVSGENKAPAVIYCSGHTPLSYRSPTYQRVILNLVKKGFVVFAFDPVGQGERLGYYDPATDQSLVGTSSREHAIPSAQLLIAGSSLTRYMVWDGIRAVDYLQTRKEVDPARIGMTGRSGGGFQTTFIAAMDDRIYAAAPENSITNHKRRLQSKGPQGAEQNLVHGVLNGLDHADYLEVRAPKPALVLTTTNDFMSIQGAMEVARETARIYKQYGKSGNFSMVQDMGKHVSTKNNREATYAFFQKHLNNPGSPEDWDVELLSDAELRVTSTGQLSTSMDSETVFSLNRKNANKLAAQLQKRRSVKPGDFSSVMDSARELAAYKEPNEYHEPVLTGIIERPGYTIEKYFVKSDGDYIIPYLLFVPDQNTGKAFIYLYPEGKKAGAAPGGSIENLVNKGWMVLAPDLIGTGEMGPGSFYRPDYFSHARIKSLSYQLWDGYLLINKTILGMRAGDVVRLARVLNNKTGVKKVYSLAHKEMTPVLLHAAAFEPIISGVALIQPLISYHALITHRLYDPNWIESTVPSALTSYDLPDLAASLAPRKLIMLDVQKGALQKENTESFDKEVHFIESIYNKIGAKDALKIMWNDSLSFKSDALNEWLK